MLYTNKTQLGLPWLIWEQLLKVSERTGQFKPCGINAWHTEHNPYPLDLQCFQQELFEAEKLILVWER